MKKIWVLLAASLLAFSGCSTSALEDYKKALIETDAYTSGVTTSDLSIDLLFDETGLSFEEIRDLSYYEHVDVVTTSTYKAEGDIEKAIVEGYFNFGGLGFDMVYYINGEEILIRLPIMDKYIDVETGTYEGETTNDEQSKAVRRVIDAWNSILSEEDVFSGSKAYLMTDKGQIKTTTYTVNIDENQFDIMKRVVLEIIEDEQIIDAFLKESGNMIQFDAESTDVQANLKALLEHVSLVNFEGKAFVDFDGRLVKQTISCDLVNTSALPGDIKTLHIDYESSYDLLGEVTDIQIPIVSEDDMLDVNDDGTIEDYFPEGLF